LGLSGRAGKQDERGRGGGKEAGELKDRVLSALLYPAIVLAVSLAVTIFLMVVVVPMLLGNLIEAGRQLPWPTRLLKGTSDLLVERGWLPLAAAALTVLGISAAMRTRRGRRAWHWLLLRIPLIGPMARKQTIARIALVLATLIRSGIVYLKAVEIVVRSTSNLIFREALEASARDVGAGRDISQALERTGVFPPLVVHIFSVGQQSGRLEEMLERLATDYDRQVAGSSVRLASALEPLLILTLALFVGFILFATLLPILEAGNVL
jgi:type II secretory pathway component PulF